MAFILTDEHDDHERIDWLKKHRTHECPKCSGQPIPYTWVEYTGYCPHCRLVWRIDRNLTTWTVNWSYIC